MKNYYSDRAFQIGGSLATDAPSYVKRRADVELISALQKAEFCYVFNSRQMGKSSLLVRTLNRLEKEGNVCVSIDLTYLGNEFTSPLQWYKGITAQLWMESGLTHKVDFKAWWQEREFSYLQRLGEFIRLLLTYFPQQKIFIFIDEIDCIQSLNFSVDDFFALIRYCYNQRAIDSNYQRIAFALFGVTSPRDLIQNKSLTPFNIGKAIAIEGFQLNEVKSLRLGLLKNKSNLAITPIVSQEIIKEILSWTNGQPFLTQKLCQLVIDYDGKITSAKETIAEIVERNIIHNWQAQDEPEHLRTIRDRLLDNSQTAGRLLGIYQQIVQSGWVTIDNTPEQTELLLSGLVIKENNYLIVKNPIYQKVFNCEWVEAQLANLRPYRLEFDAWLQNGKTNHLLTGLALKEALAWAEDKQLSDLDYRFLKASQQLAQQETEQNLAHAKIEREKAQFALYSVREANRLLAIAHQNASQKIRQLRLSPNWIFIIAIAVSILTISLRFTGSLQGLELTAIDFYFQQRPVEIAPRVTIITVDESDIRNLGYPLSDRILAKAIAKIVKYQPRVVGLDLYRDLPIPPGNQELQQIFASTPNLIGIEKVVGAKIAPPPQLAEANKVGFADLVFDNDGAIRRALLSIRDDNDIKYSFALRLALEYLQTEKITPQPLANTASHIQLGKTILIPFQPNDGGYIRADAGGYQTLINYRGTLAQFTHYSISHLLTGSISVKDIKDRVVLIGAISPTINDLSPTPYSRYHSGITNQMAWITIHANIISQLLSAALDGRAMLRTISNTGEWLCILIGAMLGALIGWWLRNWYRAIALVLISIVTIFLTYLAFLLGLWLPIVPMAIAISLGAATVIVITQRQLATMQLKETVKQLIIISDSQPTVRKVAFELLKQGEDRKNRAAIEKIVNH